MNKKGSVFLGLALGVFLFITGVLILPYITDDIDTFRNALSCGDSDNISDGTKVTCLFAGALVPYYIWFFVSLSVGLVIGGSRT